MRRLRRETIPQYLWGVLHAAHLARELGEPAASTLEFGVATGRGLLALERAAAEVEAEYGVRIEVYGFDTGRGLPKPRDHRDLPNLFYEGQYAMDVEGLRGRLTRADLILGLIADTLPSFLARGAAPVGFVSIDVDLYVSTVDVLRLFEAPPAALLPRVHCYLDDVLGFTYASFNGERLAVEEFNVAHETRKLSPIHGLRIYVPKREARAGWVEAMLLAHILDHPRYGDWDGLGRSSRGSHCCLRP